MLEALCWSALKNGLEMSEISEHCGQLNGSWTTAPATQQVSKTVAFAAALGIVSKFTPARSPQSNGIDEALVKHSYGITFSAMICQMQKW